MSELPENPIKGFIPRNEWARRASLADELVWWRHPALVSEQAGCDERIINGPGVHPPVDLRKFDVVSVCEQLGSLIIQ